MPYVEKEKRERQLNHGGTTADNVGDLTFEITELVDSYLYHRRPFRYQHLAECIAALEAAKLELYRRIVGPYEDLKRVQNGDVYHCREKGEGIDHE